MKQAGTRADPAWRKSRLAANHYPENTGRLWRDVFHGEIDVRREIIEPAIARRRVGYGPTLPGYKMMPGFL
jgi:hypothetical protein